MRIQTVPLFGARTLEDGIRAYSKFGLRIYDALVMEVFGKHVWGCAPEVFVGHYRRHITSNHADVGVGTGYCLDRCGFDAQAPRIALIDLSENCLEHAAARLARYAPETYVRNALEPIQIDTHRFDSIGLGGVLHCLSGSMRDKGRVFDALRPIAAPGAKVFGYSLVVDRVGETVRRRFLHAALNRARFIDNRNDRMADLGAELSRRFSDCRLQLIGGFAFFSAVVPQNRHAPREF